MAQPRFHLLRRLGTAIRLAARPGGPSMVQRLGALPRLARAVARGEYHGSSAGRLLLMVGALGWVVSPIDLLPEAVLGIAGLLDDAFVVSWLAATVVTETEAFLEWERGIAPERATPGTWGPSAAASPEPVPGHVVR